MYFCIPLARTPCTFKESNVIRMTCLYADRISRQIKEKYNEYSKYAAPELKPRDPLELKLILL
jgi:hypothetical protein